MVWLLAHHEWMLPGLITALTGGFGIFMTWLYAKLRRHHEHDHHENHDEHQH